VKISQRISDFFNLYGKGDVEVSLKRLFFSNENHIEFHGENSSLERRLAYYAFSLFFGLPKVVSQQVMYFNQLCSKDVAQLKDCKKFIDQMSLDSLFFMRLESKKKDFSELEKIKGLSDLNKKINMLCRIEGYEIEVDQNIREKILEGLPERHYVFLSLQLSYVQNLITFSRKNKKIAEHLKIVLRDQTLSPFIRPYYPLLFSDSLSFEKGFKSLLNSDKDCFYIHMSPLEADWKLVADRLKDRKVIFIFDNNKDLLFCLKDKEIAKTLTENNHYLISLQYSVLKQLSIQNFSKSNWEKADLISFKEENLSYSKLSNSFKSICENNSVNSSMNTSYARDLYDIYREVHYKEILGFWGESSILQLQFKMFWDARFFVPEFPIEDSPSLHKVMIKDQKRSLETLVPSVCKLPTSTKKTYKVAHCLPFLIDCSNHAPTNRLKELLFSYKGTEFEPHLWITEQDFSKKDEMPINYSQYSVERASKDLLENFRKEEIKVFYGGWGHTFYDQACVIAKQIEEQEIDVVIFHEAFSVNLILARLLKVPCKLFMEHGIFSYQEGVDGVIVSHQGQLDRMESYYKSIDTKIYVNPKILDIQSDWEDEVCSKNYFGINKKSKLLMTVSNHLVIKISLQMCEAIEMILESVPNSYYVMIGNTRDSDKEILSKFKSKNLHHRIIFWGASSIARQLIRSADIYLNEFPVGGSCTVMEAMGAGVPVIAMKGEGNFSASYEGEDYIGSDLCVEFGDVKGYANQAIELLKDSEKMKERKRIISERIALRGTSKDYLSRHHSLLREVIESKKECLV
jgi:glycosyltransferase involved in cell wall biosynthesis